MDPVAFADWVKTKSLGNFIEPTSAEWAQGAIAEANQEAVQEADASDMAAQKCMFDRDVARRKVADGEQEIQNLRIQLE